MGKEWRFDTKPVSKYNTTNRRIDIKINVCQKGWDPEMNHEEVGRYWDENATVWTKLARDGYDVYRDYLNTPAFFRMLPDVNGLSGLDIGCGDGRFCYYAKKYLAVEGLDISKKALTWAKAFNPEIQFYNNKIEKLKIKDKYDGAVCIEVLEHIPECQLSSFLSSIVSLPIPIMWFSS